MKIKIKSVLVSLCYIGLIGAIPLTYVIPDFVRYRLHVRPVPVVILLSFMIVLVYLGLLVVSMAIIECSSVPEEATETQDSEPNHEPVASNHGSNTQEVMEAIRNENLEYLACFSLNGKKLAEGTYFSPIKCNITTEDWNDICCKGEEVMEVHNHPDCYNVAFSAQDLKSFLQKDFIRKTIVVTKDYNYILEKVGNGYEDLQDDAKAYVEKMDIKYTWLSLFSPRLWSVVVARKTAEKFGLQFRIERINPSPVKRIIPVGIAACVAIAAFYLVEPQFFNHSANATVSTQYDAADEAYNGNTQTAGGRQDNIVTEGQLANEIVSGYIDTPM